MEKNNNFDELLALKAQMGILKECLHKEKILNEEKTFTSIEQKTNDIKSNKYVWALMVICYSVVLPACFYIYVSKGYTDMWLSVIFTLFCWVGLAREWYSRSLLNKMTNCEHDLLTMTESITKLKKVNALAIYPLSWGLGILFVVAFYMQFFQRVSVNLPEFLVLAGLLLGAILFIGIPKVVERYRKINMILNEINELRAA